MSASPTASKDQTSASSSAGAGKGPAVPVVMYPGAGGPATSPDKMSPLEKEFQAIQANTQKLFVSGDFAGSIASGLKALEIAKQLPPLIATTEIVQIHLNCSSGFMQMQKFPEAVEHADLAVKEAENGIKLRPNQPQALEVLAVAFGTKAFSLLNAQRYDEASAAAERSLAIAEQIYPKNDPRLHKPIRGLGLVREKQGKLEEAEKLLLRSYTILSISLGPQTTEAQMSVDELCNLMIKKNDLAGAEKYARLNYKALCDKKLDERGELILGDSASRVAQVIRRQPANLPEAEELMARALKIREEKLLSKNPIGVAFTLAQLASICEAQGKLGKETEDYLMRALDIFSRTKGQASPEVQSTLHQLRNLHNKRKVAAGAAPGGAAGDEDGIQYAVTSESKGRMGGNTTSGAGGPANAVSVDKAGRASPPTAARTAGGTTAAPLARAPIPASTLSDDEEMARLKFGPEDGMSRMMAADTFFQQGRFGCAEMVLAQALEIFMRQKGPNDQLTQAARQNLGVARNNGLNKLWMKVVAELVLEQEEKLSSSLSSNNLAGVEGGATAGADSKGAKNFSAEEKGHINEYAALMSGAGKSGKGSQDPLAAALFNDTDKASKGGCIVC